MFSDKEYFIFLSTFPAFGPRRMKLLLTYFETPENVWKATKTELKEVGLRDAMITRFFAHKEKFDQEGYLRKLKQKNIRTLTLYDGLYPSTLAGIDDAPYVLYVKGTLTKKDEIGIGVVGSRKMTSYGKEVTENITRDLCFSGITIISGFARGVDTTAHKAAIKAGGRTIAVLPSGLDIIYPPENIHVVEEIASHGALISEYPLGFPAIRENFPQRNRIISGLSKGVLVIEGQKKSGTLLTAKHAAEQGRPVFAVPGNITSYMSEAPNYLIHEGAKIVLSVSDIVDELGIQNGNTPVLQEELFPANAMEAKILEALSLEPLHLDEAVRITAMSTSEISATLVTMELKGLVRNMGNGVYKKI